MGQKYKYRPILILIILGLGTFALEDHDCSSLTICAPKYLDFAGDHCIYFTAWKGCMDVVKHWCRNVQQFKKMFAIVQERKATACKE